MREKSYTEEQAKELVHLYLNEGYDVYELADHFGKSYRSVISRLVRFKIYVPPKKEILKDTEKMMIRELEEICDVEFNYSETTASINLNRKDNLMMLRDAIKERMNV